MRLGQDRRFGLQMLSPPIEKAGHWVHHDQLEPFLKIVRHFLSI